MNRRQFAIALAGIAGAGSSKSTILEAIAAPTMPRVVKVRGVAVAPDDTRVFEMRTYRFAPPELDALLERNGIRPILRDRRPLTLPVRYLIPFESLDARQAAWTELNTHPGWIEMRERIGDVSEVVIYRRYPGGRIFEMSL